MRRFFDIQSYMRFLSNPTAPAKFYRTAARYVLLLLLAIPGYGQIEQSVFLDAGSSTVSDGAFLRPALTTSYRIDIFFVSTGFQWTFSSAERKIFSGAFISAGSDFKIREIPLSADLFFLRNPFSNVMKETCFGATLKHERRYLDIHFGYHMRRYRLKVSAFDSGAPMPGSTLSLWEYRNFMYRGTLRLKERDAPWNLSASVTNYDYFIIQQETNPLFNIAGCFSVSDALEIRSSLWYQGAGMMNVHANHYGFYFRTGIVWQVGY